MTSEACRIFFRLAHSSLFPFTFFLCFFLFPISNKGLDFHLLRSLLVRFFCFFSPPLLSLFLSQKKKSKKKIKKSKILGNKRRPRPRVRPFGVLRVWPVHMICPPLVLCFTILQYQYSCRVSLALCQACLVLAQSWPMRTFEELALCLDVQYA